MGSVAVLTGHTGIELRDHLLPATLVEGGIVKVGRDAGAGIAVKPHVRLIANTQQKRTGHIRVGAQAQVGLLAEQLRELDVKVIFSEMDFPSTYVDTIQRESGVKLYPLSHISYGDYSADKYEKEMTGNLNTVVRAIQEAGA